MGSTPLVASSTGPARLVLTVPRYEQGAVYTETNQMGRSPDRPVTTDVPDAKCQMMPGVALSFILHLLHLLILQWQLFGAQDIWLYSLLSSLTFVK